MNPIKRKEKALKVFTKAAGELEKAANQLAELSDYKLEEALSLEDQAKKSHRESDSLASESIKTRETARKIQDLVG